MEALKTFLTGLVAVAVFCYACFLFYAIVHTDMYGFGWVTIVAIPGWTAVVVALIMSLGSIIRREPDRSDWY